MLFEMRETERLPGSGAKKTHWPLVQASRHRPARSVAAYSCGRPLVQSPDTGFQPARIPAAIDSRRGQGAALWFLLLVRSPLSIPDSSVNRPSKSTLSGARALFGQGIGQHESHH